MYDINFLAKNKAIVISMDAKSKYDIEQLIR